MSGLRRYAPFALLVAAQIVLVIVAPSKGATQGSTLGGQFGTGTPGAAASSAPLGQPGAAASTAPGGAPPAGAGGGVTPGSSVPGSSVAANSASARQAGVSAAATGSTTGKAFCVTGLLEHPPCIGQWAGGSNGGATWQGVTDKTITVVMYRYKDNAAVNAILRATGTYISAQEEQDQFELVTAWINKHYQLYGRKIVPKYVTGNCDIAPPDDTCFRNDADQIVQQYHPFAVMFDNDSAEAAFFDELSRKGVINWGGWHFTDTFNDNLRPYHYDLFMGGDVQAEITGAWYCRRLANQKARYAGDANLQTMTRKVSVVYPDSPETTPAAQHLMSIIKKCAGSNAVYDGKYSSDTSTAAQQATTNTANTKAAGVTTVLWFSDPIAPAYGTKAQSAQNYHPEEVLAGSGLVDYDALAQAYDQSEWAHAFGPSDLGKAVDIMQVDAGRIWKAMGRSGKPNGSANLLTTYELSLSMGITAAGPKLTPLAYEYGLLTAPGYDAWSKWHDPRLVYLDWARGDYTGISDIREVYWDPNAPSPTNGSNGAYVPLNGGQRYQLSDIPTGEPKLPPGV
ncbi:MAG TPA: hypothetical protein VFJ17_01655 [Mycobacteriales bacterium]|nr:hypothetical protein [Mycobacteriales bacterium]